MKNLLLTILLCLSFSGCIKSPVPSGIGNGQIIEAIKGDIKDDKGATAEDGTTSGQTWFFFVMCGLLVVFGVIAIACKELFAAGACGIGALTMVILPTIIEAFHAVMAGFVILINGVLILAFICLVLWVVYKVFHFVPAKKHAEIKESLLDDNKEVTTEKK